MNLVIDQGNTKVKIGIFDSTQLIGVYEHPVLTEDVISSYLADYAIQRGILSSVKPLPEELLDSLCARVEKFIILNSSTSLPIKNDYETPHTLGCDRIAAAVGAMQQNREVAVVVIDAGTAITYDFVDEKGAFKGGNIAPGLYMRLRALHEFTGKLPLISPEGEIPEFGRTTANAIRSGVVRGICFEMEGFITMIKSTYPSVLVFLTGGDGDFFAKKLNYPIFVDNNLVLRGLNRILNYNVEK